MTEPHDTVASADAGEQLILNSPEQAKTPRDLALWAGVILLAVLTIYSPALHGKFLWDDDRHVEQNRGLRDAEGLANIWTAHWQYRFADASQRPQVRVYTPQYYPLTHTSYWLEYQLSGAQPGDINPTVFHATNIVLHSCGAILLWFLLRELAVPGAWAAAAIWALHPLQTESVAWISERKNILAGVFFFGTILTFLRSRIGSRVWGPGSGPDKPIPDPRPQTLDPLYFLSLAMFLCAVLSKSIACSAPAVILLLLWWKRGRLTARDVLATMPMFIVGLVLAALTSWTEWNFVRAEGADYRLSLLQRALLAGNAAWFYIGKLLWPAKLSFIYPKWKLDPARPALWIDPVALVLVLAILFGLRKRIGRGPVVAMLVFLCVVFPALGLVNFYPMRYSYVADHFQYLAAPALIALLVALAARLMRRISASAEAAPYFAAGAVLLVLSGLTLKQSFIFASPVELWRDTAAKNPRSWMVRNNYGAALYNTTMELGPDRQEDASQMLDEAAREFALAMELKPDHDRALTTWGRILLLKENPAEALKKFDRALTIDPNNVDALQSRGDAMFELKNLDEAATAYRAALAAAETQRLGRLRAAPIMRSLARVLLAQGKRQDAAAQYERATAAAPQQAQWHYEYGNLLKEMGKPPDAAKEFALAITAQPAHIDARIALARLMIEVGNLRGAQTQLLAAARINVAYPPLMDAARAFDVAYRKAEAATRPSTTQSSSAPATNPS